MSDYNISILKGDRDVLLNRTDWMVIKAVEQGTTIEDKWKTYRQQLRDMDFSDIDNIVFPTKPTE
tara:strand:- start:12 stop:206 length:195 start_codon:yes stop_codon:yes gene_type:complete